MQDLASSTVTPPVLSVRNVKKNLKIMPRAADCHMMDSLPCFHSIPLPQRCSHTSLSHPFTAK
ncbi:hypothetical protein E2C01_063920 [Portunus trituberculatus]|uniref:Uncharacterized protein n=1 Tax=Portunus trituberculatus TaxID=210409 RepID=A0A5B7HIY7_PORTR|nr:hypothetical protein [Portunus trituberculatus]